MTVPCPDCGKVVKEQGLGPHRRLAHGYRTGVGRDVAVVEVGADGWYHCPECPPHFQGFKKPTGLGKHRSTAHGIAGRSRAARSMRKRSKAETPVIPPSRYCALGRHKSCATLFGGFAPCGCSCHPPPPRRRRSTVTVIEQPTPPSAEGFSGPQA